VEPDALDPANAKEREAEVVLQAAGLALDSGAAAVEAAPLIGPRGIRRWRSFW